MRSLALAAFIISLSGSALAVTQVDPVLGNSTAAIAEPAGTQRAPRIDPILGNSPVAITTREPDAPAAPPSPPAPAPVRPHHGHNHGHRNVHIINQYYSTPYLVQTIDANNSTVTLGVTNANSNESATVDGQEYVLLNRWRGTCYNRNCMLSSGYMASNPNKGVIILMNPNLKNGPQVFFPASESGPLLITQDNSLNNQLVIESQGGVYSGTKTKGGERFSFNIAQGEWQF